MMKSKTKPILVERAVVMLLLLMCSAWTFAAELTAEQAMKQAQAFVRKYRTTAGGPLYAPGVTPKLTMTGRVSGLYVFNNATDGGYVIVSNDDRAVPILGFSTSGKIDPDAMPDNMRNWLQGYADEIAWLEKNASQPPLSAPLKSRLRIGSHSTTAIAPLISTTWNQGAPYNNLCPAYSGSNKSATGCVATAMAQVMNYHKWPQSMTDTIPGYITSTYKLNLSALAPTIFDWANMPNGYADATTYAQKTAVATLMKYCGWSVEMNYGPSSGSNTDKVAIALKDYFDYNTTTTQYVTRSTYTYANWIDLIYHELANSRPVVYGGQSSGGGHEFVCDGYKYESETDFFHINWGWEGQSDDYFVLSALDPNEQGIGGSTSVDGFHFGQDAVIGIQPSTGTGTVADITPNTISLTLNSISLSKASISLGESVDVIVSVTNNSEDPYDGDIMIYDANQLMDLVANTFVIEPGETKECVFTIQPQAIGTFSFIPIRNDYYYIEYPVVQRAELVVRMPEGLTVYDGRVTSQTVPANCYNFDGFTRSQFIIPATELNDMAGCTINNISFYTTVSNIPYETASTVDVYVKEVDYTSISAFETKESSSVVYQGKLSIVQATDCGVLTILLNAPFVYNGGNLLVGIENTTNKSWKKILFYGQSVNGASVSGYNSTSLSSVAATQQNFIPKTTFSYGSTIGGVHVPATLAATDIAAHEATMAWTGGTGKYNIRYKMASDTTWTLLLSKTDVLTYTLTRLEQNTDYIFSVQSVDDADHVSSWKSIAFTTLVSCPMPTDLTCTSLTATTASITWIENGTATQWEVCLNDNMDDLIIANTNPFTIEGLTSETIYTIKVRAVNNSEDKSKWSAPIDIQPTEKHIIGSGLSTFNNLPTNTLYKHSLTQQIYTVAELGSAATIRSIDFYQSLTPTRSLNIYLVHTSKNSFSSRTDWETVTTDDLVYSGEVTFAANAWTTIQLESPFVYNGYENVLLVIDDNTGSIEGTSSFRVFGTETNQALYIRSDNTDYDPTSTLNSSGTLSSVKNQIRLLKDAAPSVIKPSGLTVDYTGGQTATVRWNSTAEVFDIDVNGNVTENVSNPHILTDLTYATTYNIKVRAKNGTDVSDWTKAYTFATDICAPEDMCSITFKLTDSYGDTWNGNAIMVVDVQTGIVIGTVSNTTNDTSNKPVTDTVLLPVPDGREIQFLWVSGSYSSECSYEVYDINGEIIFAGNNALNAPVNYTVSCYVIPWKAPSDLEISEIGGHSAQLSWTENSVPAATAWVVAYKADGATDFTEVTADSNPFTLTGLSPETEYTVKVRPATAEVIKWSNEKVFTTEVACPVPTDLAIIPSPTSAIVTWSGFGDSYNVCYRASGRHAQVIFSDDFENGLDQWIVYTEGQAPQENGWYTTNPNNGLNYDAHSGSNVAIAWSWNNNAYNANNWLVSPQVSLGGTLKFWVRTNAGYPDSYEILLSTTGNETVDFTETLQAIAQAPNNNEWNEVYIDLSNYSGQQGYIAIHHVSYDCNYLLIDDFAVYGEASDAGDWTNTSTTETSITLTGLATETMYDIMIQAVNSEGTSNWTAIKRFTTLESNPVPTNIMADLAADGATITWNGFGDSYNVQYRTAANFDVLFFDDFENGLDQWTSVRNGAGTVYTDWRAFDATNFSNASNHSGNYGAMSRSWNNNTAYSVDNWLITPQVTLDGTLRFWVLDDGSYHEHYDVYVSTTGNDLADFTLLYSPGEASATWTEVSVDLSSYAGQQGYIALRHTDNDQDYLLIDDFGIFKSTTPTGTWQELAVTDATATLSGLATNNGYEYRIQSVKGDRTSEWSETKDFALLALQDATANSNLIINHLGRLAHVTLSGRTLFKDGEWNTICLPFNLTIDDSPFANATVKCLDDGYIEDTSVSLFFITPLEFEAGEPYIIKWEDGSDITNPEFANVTISVASGKTNVYDSGNVKFIGYYDPFVINTPDNDDIYYMTAGNKLKRTGKERTLKACRAYFQFSEAAAAAREFILHFGDDEVVTGTENLLKTNTENTSVWYSLDGMRHDKQPKRKGVYISNRHKIVVK